MQTLISARNISKHYDGVPSLTDVAIEGKAGSIHAVTGENGAGKSTLMKIIAGVVKPSAGELFLQGKPVVFRSPLDALNAGISTVFQEFSLVPNLTVAETMFLGRELRRGVSLDRAAMNRGAEHALAQVGLLIDPRRSVNSLTVAEQQSVEIAKGLTVDAQIFIFDEPTAALNTQEVTRLEKLLLELRDRGKCIFYISHRMREIFELCDTATVLKDGKLVGSYPTAELNADRLLALMVGRDLAHLYPPKAQSLGGAAFKVERLRVGKKAQPLSFEIKRGEIVALAGLEGQGQREIVRTLAGVQEEGSAQVEVIDASGAATRFSPGSGSARSLHHGVAFMPEDRKAEGLYLDLPIHENLTLGLHQTRKPWSLVKRYAPVISRLVQELSIRASSTSLSVVSLSGGNQQKVMLGRWLAVGARVLLIEEPTRGVDVGAKTEIYSALRRFCAEGGAVLFTSRELPEVIGVADRVLVIKDNLIVVERAADAITEEDILQAATGTPISRTPEVHPS
jgi:ribose transport system ATP-binding protein